MGEAHYPETHLIPRIVIPLINSPSEIQNALGLGQGFRIFGDEHATRDGTAIRDYLHVLDLADAHVRALNYLLSDGDSDTFNLGTGTGYSVREIVQSSRETLNWPDFDPAVVPPRLGDPAVLVASSDKAQRILVLETRTGHLGNDFVRLPIGTAVTGIKAQFEVRPTLSMIKSLLCRVQTESYRK